MAAAAGAAGGGGGLGGAGGEDVPDIRFLVAGKMNLEQRSKEWWKGNKNSPLNEDISLAEKEGIFINFLTKCKISQSELYVQFQASDQIRRQPAAIVERINRAGHLSVRLGRKRRHALFLMILLDKILNGSKRLNHILPRKYRDPSQLKGDIKALEEGIKALFAEIVSVCDEVQRDAGVHVQYPHVFTQPLQLPESKKPESKKPKSKK